MKTNTKILLASFLRRAISIIPGYRSSDGLVRVKRSGITWELDLQEGIDFAIFLFGSFEPATQKICKELIKDGDVVYDIGANIGSHSLMFAKLVGQSGRVISFEPTDYAFRKLQHNLSLNRELSERVLPYQVFLGRDESEPVPEQIHSSWPLVKSEETDPVLGANLKGTSGASRETLSGFVEKYAKEYPPSFVKIDVDGHEREVLIGALPSIRKYRPIILIEYMTSGILDAGWGPDEFLDFFRELEYEVYHSNLKDRTDAEGLGKIRVGAGVNLFCLPSPVESQMSQT